MCQAMQLVFFEWKLWWWGDIFLFFFTFFFLQVIKEKTTLHETNTKAKVIVVKACLRVMRMTACALNTIQSIILMMLKCRDKSKRLLEPLWSENTLLVYQDITGHKSDLVSHFIIGAPLSIDQLTLVILYVRHLLPKKSMKPSTLRKIFCLNRCEISTQWHVQHGSNFGKVHTAPHIVSLTLTRALGATSWWSQVAKKLRYSHSAGEAEDKGWRAMGFPGNLDWRGL